MQAISDLINFVISAIKTYIALMLIVVFLIFVFPGLMLGSAIMSYYGKSDSKLITTYSQDQRSGVISFHITNNTSDGFLDVRHDYAVYDHVGGVVLDDSNENPSIIKVNFGKILPGGTKEVKLDYPKGKKVNLWLYRAMENRVIN